MIDASLYIDLHRRRAPVQPLVFGQFIEHMGRCIYGGIYDPDSPLADSRGLRPDVIEAMHELRTPVLRWPGGNFASAYHWPDGVGPVDSRPTRWDLAWQKPEPNKIGTHEFIDLCRALNTEPFLCANMGNGTMDEAAAWVEYCNRDPGTYYADLRRKNGAEQPFGVRYWSLGNEVFGFWQIGHTAAGDYARRAVEYAKAMKRVDPSIKLVGCGAHEIEWDWEVLKTLGPSIDYISIHAYFVPYVEGFNIPGWPVAKTDDPYYSLLACPTLEEEYITDLKHMINAARRLRGVWQPITIAFDEWNAWHRTVREGLGTDPHIEEPYDLRDALCDAAFLNTLRRNSDVIGMANFAQTVNVIGAIHTSKDGLVKQTVFYPLVMQRDADTGVVLDALVESESFSAKVKSRTYDVGYLDACVTLDEEAGRLHLSLVNFHKTEPLRVTLKGVGAADAGIQTLNGDSPESANTFERPDAVCVRREQRRIDGAVELEPHSATVVQLKLA